MRSIILSTLILIVTLTFPCHAKDTNVTAGIQIHFDADGVLSKDEIKTAVKLASACGVSNVAEIYTYKMPPTRLIGIGVKSSETIKGRNISFVTVMMDSEKFLSRRTKEETKRIFKSNGKFWVSRGGVITNTLTTFAGKGGPMRVHLEDNFSIDLADRIMAAFVAGKIRYADEKVKEQLRNVNLAEPEGLGFDKDKKKFGISFRCGPVCIAWLECTFDENGVTIYSVSKIIA